MDLRAFLRPGRATGEGIYRKYGPLPPGGPAQWYNLPGVAFTTASVGGNPVQRIDFTLTDGGTGDDTVVDGVIVDQGGPPTSPSPIPLLDPLPLMLLGLLLAISGAIAIRRIVAV